MLVSATVLLIGSSGYLLNDSLSGIVVDPKEVTIGVALLLAALFSGVISLRVRSSCEKTKTTPLILIVYAGLLLLFGVSAVYQMTRVLGVDGIQITTDVERRKVLKTPLGRTLLFPGDKKLVKTADGGYWFVAAEGLRKARWYESRVLVVDPSTGAEIRVPKRYGIPSR